MEGGTGMRIGTWALGPPGAAGIVALLAVACSGGEGTSTPSEPAGPAPVPREHAAPFTFAIRGRLDDPSDLPYRLELDGSPVDEATFRAVVADAAAQWDVPGRVHLRPAREGEAAALTLGFRRGTHERGCPSFGTSRSVAHSGPVSMDSFVHFDAGRRWREARGDGPSLRLAAVHELGHALGLAHVSRGDALMFADPQDPDLGPTPSDLAGLHSLYGGGSPPPGSLSVKTADGSTTAVLHGIAPVETHDWTLYDVDGDGADELVTWRIDLAGDGEVTVFRFGRGPVLERTIGPQAGVTSPSASTFLGVDQEGEHVLAAVFEGGRYAAHTFDRDSILRPLPPSARRVRLDEGELLDADGDGVLDGPLPSITRREEGDLDGDGQLERVVPEDGAAGAGG